MGDNAWIGGAPEVAQVSSVQVTGYDAATTYKITVGGTFGAPTVLISAIAAGGVNQTATALATAWNASTHPYCTGITALATTDTVSFTADTAGMPFVINKSVSGGSGTLGSVTAVTANTSPYDWSTAANWSLGTVPTGSDNIYIRANSAIPIYWGLAQSAVTPALLVSEQFISQAMQVGLPASKFMTKPGSYDTTVPEYRQQYLALGPTVSRLGENFGTNSGAKGGNLFKLDLGSTNGAVNVYSTGTGENSAPATFLKLNHASASLKQYAGKVGVNWETPNESGQHAELDLFDGEVYVGSGVTLATALLIDGKATLNCLPTTLKIESAATCQMANVATGTITTLEKRGELLMGGVAFAVTSFKG